MKPKSINHKKIIMVKAVMVLVVFFGLSLAHASDLIIIVPYNPEGTEIQQDEQWVTVAEQFEVYKEEIGLE